MLWLNRVLGPEVGSLALAAIFAGFGLILAAITSAHVVQPDQNMSAVATAARGEAETLEDFVGLSLEDRKLLMAAASTIAPAIIPGLGKAFIRNLPLVAAIAVAVFVMTRPVEDKTSPSSEQPAE
jgi:hypothetical protein